MLRVIFLVLLVVCCTNCVKTVHVCGHLFEDKEIKALQKAKSKEDIEALLGSPTTVSSFGQETWYYITTKKESVAFLQDKILEQHIIQITFKKDQSVDVITHYNEQDAKDHKLVTDITIVKGNDTSAAQQFFGNIGRFNKNKKETVSTPRSGF